MLRTIAVALAAVRGTAGIRQRDPDARLDSTAFERHDPDLAAPHLALDGTWRDSTTPSSSSPSPPFTVTILVVEAQFSLIAAGAVLAAAVQAAGLLGRLVWGWVADRWGIGDQLLIVMGALNTAGGESP